MKMKTYLITKKWQIRSVNLMENPRNYAEALEMGRTHTPGRGTKEEMNNHTENNTWSLVPETRELYCYRIKMGILPSNTTPTDPLNVTKPDSSQKDTVSDRF